MGSFVENGNRAASHAFRLLANIRRSLPQFPGSYCSFESIGIDSRSKEMIRMILAERNPERALDCNRRDRMNSRRSRPVTTNDKNNDAVPESRICKTNPPRRVYRNAPWVEPPALKKPCKQIRRSETMSSLEFYMNMPIEMATRA